MKKKLGEQMDNWGFDGKKKRKRNAMGQFIKRKRKRKSRKGGNGSKRRDFDEQSSKRRRRNVSQRRGFSCGGGSFSRNRNELEDEDYMQFIEMLKGYMKEDSIARMSSEEESFDFGDCREFRKENFEETMDLTESEEEEEEDDDDDDDEEEDDDDDDEEEEEEEEDDDGEEDEEEEEDEDEEEEEDDDDDDDDDDEDEDEDEDDDDDVVVLEEEGDDDDEEEEELSEEDVVKHFKGYPSQEKRKDCNTVKLMKPKDEPVDDVDFGKRDECMNKKPGLGTAGRVSFLSACQLDKVSCLDQSYLKFLRGVMVSNDGSLTYENGNCIVNYDENLGVVTDSEELVIKATPLSYRKPETTTYRKKATPSKPNSSRMNVSECDSGFVSNTKPKLSKPNGNRTAVNEDDSSSVIILDTVVKVNHVQIFEKKLRKFLLKPFDKKELRERFKSAKVRLPLEGVRRTRRRTVPYATEEPGLSYFDRHPDLRKMVKVALQENLIRALALLRCLSFFYENASDPGSFVPWVNMNPQSWLHNILCCCANNGKCPMNANGVSHGKRYHC